MLSYGHVAPVASHDPVGRVAPAGSISPVAPAGPVTHTVSAGPWDQKAQQALYPGRTALTHQP